MDRIYIRDLKVRCIIGIYEEERREKQDVVLNMTLAGDCSAAARSDDIAEAMNYKEIKKGVLRLAENSSFNLIETLAERVADECLRHPRVQQVTVTVDKPGALRIARSVGCEITRQR